MTRKDALEVFFSYSHRDQELRARLDTHLALLKRREVIRTWFDGGIAPGEEFEPAIFERLNAADVILLLISPDFIASEFCWSREMRRAMERHNAGEARVIPILLRPVDDWSSTPFGKLKVLPKDGLAATEWPDLDRAFRDVTAGIRQSIEDLAQRRTAPAPSPAPPLRVVLLIGHSVADPLPEAVEMAQATVRDFQSSGLAVELRVDQATAASFEREAEEGCDLFLYYGHGTEDGQLSWADGRKSFADLSRSGMNGFWRDLDAALIFACFGDRFARELPCPWIAFSEPILTQAAKGFLHALIPALTEGYLSAAVERARTRCAREMRSSFTDVMRFSEAPLPSLRPAPGTAELRRVSPALAKSHRLDFVSLRSEDHLYPDPDDPFVGRVCDLESLLRLPSPYDDRPLQRVVWIHGTAGMGKSALLRQFATFVRDLVFREADELVYLLHLHCYKFTQPEEVIAALCSRAAELYGLAPRPSTLESLFTALESRFGTRGTHVWILDDLTYLSVQPHSTEEAGRLVFALRDLANNSGLRWQLVVSSRRPGPRHFEPIEVGRLAPSEAQSLAAQVWFSSRCELAGPGEEIAAGAAHLFRVVQSTAQYKRALLLSLERGLTYRAYADSLSGEDSVDAMEHLEAAQHMLDFEVRQLAALEKKHGFAYRTFLGLYHPLIVQSEFFTQAELAEWFEDRLVAKGAKSRTQSYTNGLTYLARLGFVLFEKRAGEQVYFMPPGLRWSMRALSDERIELPSEVPFRGVEQRFWLGLEELEGGDLSALEDLLTMAVDYPNDLADPSFTAAAFESMLEQADASSDPETELMILQKIVELDDIWRSAYPADETEASEQVAIALFNKALTLGKLGRSLEAIEGYDLVVARYGERQEPAIAEYVAMALFNKGVRLGKLGRCQEEIEVYDLVGARYGDHQEPALIKLVVKALFSKGFCLGALGRGPEAIEVYDLVNARYGDRQEPALAEQVATGLVNKGLILGKLGLSQEAIEIYDLVAARYSGRPEPALAEQVVKALLNKGFRLEALDRGQEEIAVYKLIVALYGDRQEPALAELVAMAFVYKGIALAALDRSQEAIEVYDLVAARYGDRQEPALAEQVADALIYKGITLADLDRSQEAIEVYDLVAARYGDRQETALAERVAEALVKKGLRLGALDRSQEEIEVYDLVDARYGDRQEPALAEHVADALVYKGVTLGDLGRSQEEIEVYDLVAARYGDRQEPALAEQVADALIYKGITLEDLDRSQEAIEVYNLVDARFGDRQEPALAKQVAKALLKKGVCLGALGRSQEEIEVYDQVAASYGDRQETTLAEQVAKALFNKGFQLGELGRREEAIQVYDQVSARYGDRQEPALAEEVVSALGNKGWCQYELGDYRGSVVSSRAALARNPRETWVRCNLALALLHLGEVDDAKAVYAEALEEIATPEGLDRLALQDLDAALARQPGLQGAREIREMIASRAAKIKESADLGVAGDPDGPSQYSNGLS